MKKEKNEMNLSQAIAIGLACAASGCTSTQAQTAAATAASVGAQQRAICAVVQAWAVNSPELEAAAKACEQGHAVTVIAADYAGCK